jgi:hypothetical protein
MSTKNTICAIDERDEVSAEVLPVRVVARARPLSQSELLESSRSCVSFPPGGQTLVLGKDRYHIDPPKGLQYNISNSLA